MPPADAAVLLPRRSATPRATPGRFTLMPGTLEGMDRHLHDFARSEPLRVVPVQPAPLSQPWPRVSLDVSPDGLGPSVAELTIGRPPRAPRPGE